MFKRIALTLTFLAAFSAVGLTYADSAQAWRYGYGRPYTSYYAGPGVPYYGGYRSYRTAYYGPSPYYYGAPAPYVVGPPVYRSYYRAPYYYGPGPGVSVSFGY
jgi:hypothetical protein